MICRLVATGLAAMALAAPADAQEMSAAVRSAVLRGLDKVTGTTTDIDLTAGQTIAYGRLKVTMTECRYPVEDPTSNAYAHVTVEDTSLDAVVFDAWMVASSPALSAMDDPRYDIWLLRCKTS